MMINNVFFSVISLLYSIMLLIIYFSKERISNEENRIYKYLIICNFIGLLIEIFPSTLAIRTIANVNMSLTIMILKFILYYFIIWILLFSYYIYIICINNNRNEKENSNRKKILRKLLILIGVISIILITILPMKIHEISYTYGPAVNIVFIISGLLILSWFVILLKNIKYLKSKKYTPIFTFIVLGFFTMLIQSIYPELTLLIPMETFITFLMYHTIENPDIKMLNELYKSKELVEQNYVEKYNFLFETAEEVREPLKEIKKIVNNIDTNNKENVDKGLILINNIIKHLDFTINNVLDISVIDVSKLKLVDTRYSLANICEDIVLRIKKELSADVKFETNIPSVSPILYGDYIKIKQIVYSILMNSIKRLDEGYILFKVDLLEKYDTCRIIFTISDNGIGIPVERINEILSSTGEFSKDDLLELQEKEINIELCQKVIKIMGGNLMIKSDLERGCETKLIIDQRIYRQENADILEKYINSINNYRKTLIISQDKNLISSIKRCCKNNNIIYTNIYSGLDAIDNIKSGKKYDFILISAEMKKMTGFSILKKLQQLDNFNMPIIVMLNKDKELIKEHFKEDGFNDYLLTDNFQEEFERIINKY